MHGFWHFHPPLLYSLDPLPIRFVMLEPNTGTCRHAYWRHIPRKTGPLQQCSVLTHASLVRLKSMALSATITVEALINTAATAGESSTPQRYATPAARGKAITL